MQRRLVGIIASATIVVLACATLAETMTPPLPQTTRSSGVVLDARTRQPVAGAYVVARWLEQHESPGGVRGGRCLHRVVTRADAQGRFEIPDVQAQFAMSHTGWSADRRSYTRDLHAWAPGLVETVDRDGADTLLLAGGSASAREHVRALRDTLAHFTCTARFPEPAPIAEQLYAEAWATACLPDGNALPELRELFADAQAGALATASCARARQASSGAQ